jgi:dTDP-4-dehydrorhamnose 3,5-epimerase
MKFHTARLAGVVVVELEPARDERGYFARTFCAREFASAGLATNFVQQSYSLTHATGTLRGMHFQRAPHAEVKLVRCLSGAIYDVLIDLRPTSPTYRQWESFELTERNGRQLYIPAGLAHGFQTLAPSTCVGYMMDEFYAPASAAGVRYDDPAFRIEWPLPVTLVSERDRSWPDYIPSQ